MRLELEGKGKSEKAFNTKINTQALKQNAKVRQTENEMCMENNKSPLPMNNKRDSIVKSWN